MPDLIGPHPFFEHMNVKAFYRKKREEETFVNFGEKYLKYFGIPWIGL